MPEGRTIEKPYDAETEFRRRLSQKLAAKGYEGPELENRIEELLRKGAKLKLNIDEILGV